MLRLQVAGVRYIYIGRRWLDCDVELLLVRIPFLCEELNSGMESSILEKGSAGIYLLLLLA